MKIEFHYCPVGRLWHRIGNNRNYGTIALNLGFFAFDSYANLGHYELYFWRFSVSFTPKVKK